MMIFGIVPLVPLADRKLLLLVGTPAEFSRFVVLVPALCCGSESPVPSPVCVPSCDSNTLLAPFFSLRDEE
jgi:hypothetical protein